MLKGHLEIVLKNEKTGEVEKYSEDNLVTNAFKYILGYSTQMVSENGSNITAYGPYNVLPIGKKALGGLFLFDGPLTENVENIHFPMNVHLTGFAGQTVNTTGLHAGSINKAESGPTDTGYVNVWDFSTSQANGTIASLALTNANAGNNPFRYEFVTGTSASYNGSGTVIALDDETGDVYLYYRGKISKKRMITYVIKTNTPRYGQQEEVFDFAYPNNAYGDWTVCNGYDGYLYAIKIPYVSKKGTVTITIRKIKISDWSFDEEPEQTITISNITSINTYEFSSNLAASACISKGYLYFISYDRKTIYKVDMSNVVDVQSLTLDEKYIHYVFPKYNGGIFAYLSYDGTTSTGSTTRYYCCGIVYEDGDYCFDEEYKNTTSYYTSSYTCYESDRLYRAVGTIYNAYTQAYLGTICNLSSPVVKTSAQSMKVTYTLTDV